MPLEATLREKKCVTCGETFKPNSARQKYCSERCKRGAKSCEVCKTEFTPKGNTTGKYCSPACWYKASHDSNNRNCVVCGKTFHRETKGQRSCSFECANVVRRTAKRNTHCACCGEPLRPDCHPRARFCSKSCGMKDRDRRGQLHAPEGTKQKHSNGYVLIKVGKSWVLEHRHVMAQKIGRPLTRADHVHHKNGVRHDNRPDNLELWSGRKDPAGQRASDLLEDFLMQPEIAEMPETQRETIRGALLRTIFKL